jgi:hypothetical protein
MRRLLGVKRDLEQLLRDEEWVNNNRDDIPPFDVGGLRVWIAKVNECIEQLRRDGYSDPRLAAELCGVAERVTAAGSEEVPPCQM